MNPSDSQPTTAPALLISSEGIILDAHDAICAALGWAREELVNKTAGDLFEYGADLVLIRMQEIQSGASNETEFSVSHARGRPFAVERLGRERSVVLH